MYFAFFSGVMGSICRGTADQRFSIDIPERSAQKIGRRLTEFPITRTRPLKVVGLKVGKVSTERTGHLGVVALILTIHLRENTGQ